MSESPETDSPAVPDYRRRVLSSLAWTGSAQFLGQLVSWAATIIVIRILDPGDYGIMAMATLFVSFVLMLSDLGIGAAIVQAEEIDDEDLRSIQGLIWLEPVGDLGEPTAYQMLPFLVLHL